MEDGEYFGECKKAASNVSSGKASRKLIGKIKKHSSNERFLKILDQIA